jgi:5'-nucleotidase
MQKARIAIDMDEVMTDSISRFIQIYQQEFNEDLSDLRLPGRTLRNTVPADRLEAVLQYPHQAEFFKDLPIKEGCAEVVRQLHEQHEVFVATAAMEFELCFTDKFNWLKQHLPFIPWTHIVFCGDKSILKADYLIDDVERNLKAFTGTSLVFTAPHNTHLQEYTRFNNWQEVADYFLK